MKISFTCSPTAKTISISHLAEKMDTSLYGMSNGGMRCSRSLDIRVLFTLLHTVTMGNTLLLVGRIVRCEYGKFRRTVHDRNSNLWWATLERYTLSNIIPTIPNFALRRRTDSSWYGMLLGELNYGSSMQI